MSELKEIITRILVENRALWSDLGPASDAAGDPVSNLNLVWELRKQDTIVPNNQKIVNLVEANIEFLSQEDFRVFARFKSHATAFAEHCLSPKDSYPRFPVEFEERFRP